MRPVASGRMETHWEGCEREHHLCALARLEDRRMTATALANGQQTLMERIAALTAERDAAVAKVKTLREALQRLVDVQNGPPLFKYENEWNAVMAEAIAALAPAPGDDGEGGK